MKIGMRVVSDVITAGYLHRSQNLQKMDIPRDLQEMIMTFARAELPVIVE